MFIELVSYFQIVHGRISTTVKGYRSLDLFIQKEDGKKIVNKDDQAALCSRLKEEMLHPLRVVITNRGPDTEHLVANPTVELSGKGRPRVFYDVTLALKTLGTCVFSAEIGRHSTSQRSFWMKLEGLRLPAIGLNMILLTKSEEHLWGGEQRFYTSSGYKG